MFDHSSRKTNQKTYILRVVKNGKNISMRINVYLTTFYCLLFFYTQLATAQICNSISQEILDANEVSARLLTGGDSWWDSSDGQYIVPKPGPGEDPVTAIFAGAIWIGGVDDAGDLKLAAQTYRQYRNDYWPGPILDTDSSPGDCILWDRHYKVKGSEIDALRNDFADNGVIDNAIPTNILGWPGRGNSNFYTLFGFNLPDQDLLSNLRVLIFFSNEINWQRVNDPLLIINAPSLRK